MTVLPRYIRETIAIDLACNDERGQTIDRVDAIQVPGLDLTARDIRGVHFRQFPGGFWLSRRKWYARHVASHVGNCCWERYGMPTCRAAAFFLQLRSSQLFDVDGGFDELFRWWKSGVVGVAGSGAEETHLARLLAAASAEESSCP